MSGYMLDTDICVELLRGRAAGVFERLRGHGVDEVGISSITLAELQYGAARSSRPGYHAERVAEFCAPLAILDFDGRAAEVYGRVRAELEREGKGIGPLDTLIASHAVSLDMTLVSNNEREFRRVRGLKVENWMRR